MASANIRHQPGRIISAPPSNKAITNSAIKLLARSCDKLQVLKLKCSEKITDKTWLNTAIDAPEHYVEHSQWAMRMTDSGEFIHDAPWNARHMGEDNASHGCIGLLTEDMSWLWDNTIIGDPVIVQGIAEIDEKYGLLVHLQSKVDGDRPRKAPPGRGSIFQSDFARRYLDRDGHYRSGGVRGTVRH